VELDRLWRSYAEEVREFIRRKSGDDVLADDLTTETFLSASRALERGQEVTISWLMTVAKRRLVDHWRTEGRLKRTLGVLHDESTVRFTMDDEPQFGEVADVVTQLCPTQRAAIVLRYWQGHSVGSIAETLELSYAAAESLLARGRRAVRREYLAVVA